MRVQVNLSDEMVSKVDSIAKNIGVTRSALLAVWIGSTCDGMMRAQDAYERLGADLADTEKK